MPVDTSHIDLVSLIEQKTGFRYGKSTGKERTCKGPCPWCGGEDRFAIFTLENRYYCGIHGTGCYRYGDPIDFLEEYEGLTFLEVCEALSVDPGSYVPHERVIRPWSPDNPPNALWRESAEACVYTWERILWGKQGKVGLDYLKGRGLTEETIKQARLGYSSRWITSGEITTLEKWGFTKDIALAAKGKHTLAPAGLDSVKLPEGIVIPHYVDGVLWKVNVRRLQFFSEETPEQRQKRRYRAISGSATCLYNAHDIQPGHPLLMAESELDALSAKQTCGDLIAGVATGSTGGARRLEWITEVALASHVLIAFDKDADERGLQAAREWMKLLPGKSTIWQPSGEAKDVNDMLMQGQDIRAWVELGLLMAEPVADTPEADETQQSFSVPYLLTTARPGAELEQLRREIGVMARAEAAQWEYSTELDPRWPPSAKVYKRVRRKEALLWEGAA